MFLCAKPELGQPLAPPHPFPPTSDPPKNILKAKPAAFDAAEDWGSLGQKGHNFGTQLRAGYERTKNQHQCEVEAICAWQEGRASERTDDVTCVTGSVAQKVMQTNGIKKDAISACEKGRVDDAISACEKGRVKRRVMTIEQEVLQNKTRHENVLSKRQKVRWRSAFAVAGESNKRSHFLKRSRNGFSKRLLRVSSAVLINFPLFGQLVKLQFVDLQLLQLARSPSFQR